jgi:NAD(P)-dependent dehydrogenase (short-subunit alcohol dehydrogenase family)
MCGLEGKYAIVTGGSSGIGPAIALRLGQEGVNMAINYVGTIDGACETRSARTRRHHRNRPMPPLPARRLVSATRSLRTRLAIGRRGTSTPNPSVHRRA